MSRDKPQARSSEEAARARKPGRRPPRLLRPDPVALLSALLLTLAAAIYAYLKDMALQVPELTFLLVVFYAVVHGIRWVRGRRQRGDA